MENYLTQIINYLLTQSWQIAVLVVVIAAASLALKNKSAHVRYLLWLIVLAKCFVPPLLSVPLAVLPQEKPAVAFEAMDTTVAEPRVSPPAPVAMSATPTLTERPAKVKVTIRQWLGFGWIVGVAAFLLFALIKALHTNRWLRRQRKPLPAELQSGIGNLFPGLGFKTFPKVWLVEGIGQPFVWGLLRGSIYLPADFVNVDNAEHRGDVLGHELSHILRFDAAVNILQIIAQAIFWFHPFVWWTNRKIRAEREKCCDEMAIARLGAKAKDYSTAIVNTLIAEYESTRPVPSLAIAGPVKNIEERIKTIMKPGKEFYKRPSLIAVIVLLLAALVSVPISCVLKRQASAETAIELEGKPTKSLHRAAADGDIEQVKSLIASGADVNAKDKNGQTPLHLVCSRGNKEMAELLIAKGADINAKANTWHTTPLIAAIRSGHKDIAKLIIAEGADINAKGRGDYTALHWAAVNRARMIGSTDIMKLLLARDADIEARQEHGATPLACAAYDGNVEAVKFLIEHGADIEANTRYGDTPLARAAGQGHKDTAELLLSKGANIHVKQEGGFNLVHMAMINNQDEMVRFLVDEGLKIPPMHVAAYLGELAKVKEYLTGGAGINQKEEAGLTSLHCAVSGGHKDVVEYLIGKGADMRAKCIDNSTPFAFADTVDVAALLLAKGADVNITTKNGQTPLHWAVNRNDHRGDKDLVELLLKHGANVNAKAANTSVDWEGWTPFHVACRNGNKAIVEMLLAKGANVNAKTDKGYTPLSLAKEKGHTEIVELLRKHGAKE